jgi:hypothetical protein
MSIIFNDFEKKSGVMRGTNKISGDIGVPMSVMTSRHNKDLTYDRFKVQIRAQAMASLHSRGLLVHDDFEAASNRVINLTQYAVPQSSKRRSDFWSLLDIVGDRIFIIRHETDVPSTQVTDSKGNLLREGISKVDAANWMIGTEDPVFIDSVKVKSRELRQAIIDKHAFKKHPNPVGADEFIMSVPTTDWHVKLSFTRSVMFMSSAFSADAKTFVKKAPDIKYVLPGITEVSDNGNDLLEYRKDTYMEDPADASNTYLPSELRDDDFDFNSDTAASLANINVGWDS